MSRKGKLGQIAFVTGVSVIACTILILVSDANPLAAYRQFFYGIFGNINGFAEIFVKATCTEIYISQTLLNLLHVSACRRCHHQGA